MPVTPSPIIRAADLDDLADVYALEQACFVLDGQSRRSLRHLIARAHGDFLVAVVDEAVVADVIVLYRRSSRVARSWRVLNSNSSGVVSMKRVVYSAAANFG